MREQSSIRVKGVVLGLFALSIVVVQCVHWIYTKKASKYEVYPDYCHFTRRFYGDSTKKDALLLYVSGFHTGLELSIKSIRSTGCQCRIVLLSDDEIIFPARLSNFLDEMGVETFIKKDAHLNRTMVPHLLRYELEYDWLTLNIGKVDRVFHADAYDIYYQRDPFNINVTSESLIFVTEPIQFRSCGWNMGWYQECYTEKKLDSVLHKYIVCSGTIIGGTTPYMRFLRLLFGQPEWSKCWSESLDQPIVNHVIHNGIASSYGLNYTFYGCESDILTAHWCYEKMLPRYFRDGFFFSEHGNMPACVHQYNRNQTGFAQLYDRCQIPFVPLSVTYM